MEAREAIRGLQRLNNVQLESVCSGQRMTIQSRGISALNRFRTALLVGSAAAVLLLLPHIDKAVRAADQAEAAPQAAVAGPQDPGAQSYAQRCAICHGDRREGDLPAFPPLLGIEHRMANDKIAEMIHTGKDRMPGFPDVKDGELTALLYFLTTPEPTTPGAQNVAPHTDLSADGEALFQQNCAFCHGRDAMGGETGPDLTQSRLVRRDRTGDEIAKVIHEGRPDNKMPAFNLSTQEIRSLIAFIHAREAETVARPGGRRGVAVADLQTGNADAGRRYFDGAGGCSKCHSPSGDLAGVASRFEGLELEERMLYPSDAKSRITVTLPGGEKIAGTLAYHDEFTVSLRDARGVYRSWRADRVSYTIDAPVEAHVDLFGKYSDEDIHNLMAYLQTLR
jgi:mono/diheme cytochrome c family protein